MLNVSASLLSSIQQVSTSVKGVTTSSKSMARLEENIRFTTEIVSSDGRESFIIREQLVERNQVHNSYLWLQKNYHSAAAFPQIQFPFLACSNNRLVTTVTFLALKENVRKRKSGEW